MFVLLELQIFGKVISVSIFAELKNFYCNYEFLNWHNGNNVIKIKSHVCGESRALALIVAGFR